MISKGMHSREIRRCAAEAESMVWALIVIMVALILFGTFLFAIKVGGG